MWIEQLFLFWLDYLILSIFHMAWSFAILGWWKDMIEGGRADCWAVAHGHWRTDWSVADAIEGIKYTQSARHIHNELRSIIQATRNRDYFRFIHDIQARGWQNQNIERNCSSEYLQAKDTFHVLFIKRVLAKYSNAEKIMANQVVVFALSGRFCFSISMVRHLCHPMQAGYADIRTLRG